MNLHAVETLHQEGVTLIITVDNGIASVAEVDRARELGMDVVVTDHHRPQQRIPQACAVVDAYQQDDHGPYKDLSGAGVALKLVMALRGRHRRGAGGVRRFGGPGHRGGRGPRAGGEPGHRQGWAAHLGPGAAPGWTPSWRKAAWGQGGHCHQPGLYGDSPHQRHRPHGRPGAGGAAAHLRLLRGGRPLSQEICEDNDRRREVEAQIAQEAVEKIEKDPALLYSRVIVVDGEGWHHGVIGIVASRITERFGKPCMVISTDGDMAKGSGRSVEGFSLFQAVCACGDLMERYGGHPMAAGITLKAENVPLFRERINQYAAKTCPEMPAQVLRIDCKLNPAALSPEMPQSLAPWSPTAAAIPSPCSASTAWSSSKLSLWGRQPLAAALR